MGCGGFSVRGGRQAVGGRFASPGSSVHPPTRCVAGEAGVSRFRLRRGPFSRREMPGSVGCCCWWGGLRLGVVGLRGCALSSVGPRRQSGTCREVKRRWLGLMVDCAWRRLTSRQDPDGASPARPRREPTPWGSGASCARAGSRPVARPIRKDSASPGPTNPILDPCDGVGARVALAAGSCIAVMLSTSAPYLAAESHRLAAFDAEGSCIGLIRASRSLIRVKASVLGSCGSAARRGEILHRFRPHP